MWIVKWIMCHEKFGLNELQLRLKLKLIKLLLKMFKFVYDLFIVSCKNFFKNTFINIDINDETVIYQFIMSASKLLNDTCYSLCILECWKFYKEKVINDLIINQINMFFIFYILHLKRILSVKNIKSVSDFRNICVIVDTHSTYVIQTIFFRSLSLKHPVNKNKECLQYIIMVLYF